jgi:hypothetical protein
MPEPVSMEAVQSNKTGEVRVSPILGATITGNVGPAVSMRKDHVSDEALRFPLTSRAVMRQKYVSLARMVTITFVSISHPVSRTRETKKPEVHTSTRYVTAPDESKAVPQRKVIVVARVSVPIVGAVNEKMVGGTVSSGMEILKDSVTLVVVLPASSNARTRQK